MSFALLLLPLCILHCRGRRPRRSGYVPAACCSRRPGGSAALPLAMGVLPAVFAGADPHHALERTAERLDAVVPQPLRQIRNLAAILQQNTGRLDAELLQILGKVGAGLLFENGRQIPLRQIEFSTDHGHVGGYITFSGAHRLIDAGITGEKNLKEINKSSVMGMIIATIVRIFLFLAVLGVVVKGVTLDAANPAADAFKQGAGEIGYRFAGLVLLCAAITSIIGAAYTSVSFLKTFSKSIEENENKVIIGFIIISTAIMFILGNPAVLLVLAGAVNGLILPITLAICLIAAHKKSIMGENYHHPVVLTILGVIVVILTAYLGVTTFVSKIGTLL